MAQGSEQLTWKRLGYPPKVCAECGRDGLRLKDVAQVHTQVASGETDLRCTTCMEALVSERVERFWRA